MNVEEALREIEGKTALLRAFAFAAVTSPQPPDPPAFAGLHDVCGQVEALTRAVKAALDVDALGAEVNRRQPRESAI